MAGPVVTHEPFVTLLIPAGDPASLRHLGSYEDRKSLFLGHAARVDSAADYERFVRDVRAEHPEARHVCSAAVFTEADGDDPASGAVCERMSDDGEPSGTAARPILDAIRYSGVRDCAVAVSRKFGGTLLGAGGLVRAYSTAASSALAAAPRAELVRQARIRVRVGYARLKTLDHLLARFGARTEKREYAQDVTTIADVDETDRRHLKEAIVQAFAGDPGIEDLGSVLTVRPLPAAR